MTQILSECQKFDKNDLHYINYIHHEDLEIFSYFQAWPYCGAKRTYKILTLRKKFFSSSKCSRRATGESNFQKQPQQLKTAEIINFFLIY